MAKKHPTAGPDRFTPEKKTLFLELIAKTCNISAACRAVKISRVTAYNLRKTDTDFRSAWDKSLEIGAEALEDEARRRAMQGVRKNVYHKGEIVGTVREYSDTLLIFLLKGAKPDVYRERVSMDLKGTINVESASAELDSKLKRLTKAADKIKEEASQTVH